MIADLAACLLHGLLDFMKVLGAQGMPLKNLQDRWNHRKRTTEVASLTFLHSAHGINWQILSLQSS